MVDGQQSQTTTQTPALTKNVPALLPQVDVTWVRFFTEVKKGLLGVCGINFPQTGDSVPVSNGQRVLYLSIMDTFKCFMKVYVGGHVGIEYARDYIPAKGDRPGSLRARPSNGKFFLLRDAEGNYAEQESHRFYIRVVVPYLRAALGKAVRKAILDGDKIRVEERAMALYVANDLEALTAKEITSYARKWRVKKAEWSAL